MKPLRKAKIFVRWTGHRVARSLLVSTVIFAAACRDVEVRGVAAFPLTPLNAPEPQEHARFGSLVSTDRTALLVSAPFEAVETEGKRAERAGAVYLFEAEAGYYKSTRITLPHADASDGFVPAEMLAKNIPRHEWGALYGRLNDEFVFVSAVGEDSARRDDPLDNSAEAAGAVYIFDRADLAAPPQYLKAPDSHIRAGSLFGAGLAHSAEWLAIGAPGESAPSGADPAVVHERAGAVHMYRRHGRKFVFEVTLQPPDSKADDFFGAPVVFADNYLFVAAAAKIAFNAARGYDEPMGRVYVYRLVGNQWQAEEPIDAPPYANYFGAALSVSRDLLAAGAPGSLGCPDGVTGGGYRGTVYVMAKRDGRWSSAGAQCLLPETDDGVLFGFSVALDGNRLMVSAPLDSSKSHEFPQDTSVTSSGAVHWFEGTTSGAFRRYRYLKSQKITAFGGFGASLALEPGLLAIGAPTEPVPLPGSSPGQSLSLTEAGTVYVFREPP